MIYRYLAYGLIVLTVIGGAWAHGYHKGVIKLYEYQAKQAAEAVVIVTKRGAVTEKIVNRYIKVAAETQVVINTIEKEVTRYVETHAGYCLDAEWRRLHDNAATNAIPAASGNADGKGGAPEAATAIKTVTENYAGCNRTADRLGALQSWVEQQAKVK